MNNSKKYIELHPIPLRYTAISLLFFSAILFFQRLKLFIGPDFYYLGGSHADAGLYLYLFRHHLQHLFELPFFELAAFFPYSQTLAWSDNFIFPALVAYPLYQLGLSAEFLYNGVLLGGILLLAYTTFRTTYMLIGDFFPALIGGSIALLLSYFTFSLGHPQLVFSFFIIIGLEILFRLLSSFNDLSDLDHILLKAPKRCMLYGFYFSVLTLCCFLTTVYYAIFLALLPLPFFTAHYLLKPATKFRYILYFISGGIIALPLFYPFALPYLETKEIFGSRALDEIVAFQAQGFSYLSASPLSYLYSSTKYLSHAEAYFFPGFLVLFLTYFSFWHLTASKLLRTIKYLFLFSFILLFFLTSFSFFKKASVSLYEFLKSPILMSFLTPLLTYTTLILLGALLYKVGKLEKKLSSEYVTNRTIIGILLFIALFYLLISLGPIGRTLDGDTQWSLFTLIYYLFPGFSGVRAIARAGAISLLILPLLVALSLHIIHYRVNFSKWLFFLFLFIVGIENYLIAYALEPRDGAPPVLTEVADSLQRDEAILFLPLTDELKSNGTVKSWRNFALRNVNYMNWSIDNNLLTINGYSGQRSKLMYELPKITEKFPSIKSISSLSQISNLRHIIIDTNLYKDSKKEALLKDIERYSQSITQVKTDQNGFLLLSFHPEQKLLESSFFRAPKRWKRTSFSIELKAEYSPQSTPLSLAIREHDHLNGEHIETILLPQDGAWHSFSFSLPKNNKNAIPFRFSLKFSSENRIFYRSPKVGRTPDR